MPWAPNVSKELRNDVCFALRFKVGRKQQPLVARAFRDQKISPKYNQSDDPELNGKGEYNLLNVNRVPAIGMLDVLKRR
jgi:hypothetical protein